MSPENTVKFFVREQSHVCYTNVRCHKAEGKQIQPQRSEEVKCVS